MRVLGRVVQVVVVVVVVVVATVTGDSSSKDGISYGDGSDSFWGAVSYLPAL